MFFCTWEENTHICGSRERKGGLLSFLDMVLLASIF
jgi:hypothetical protein